MKKLLTVFALVSMVSSASALPVNNESNNESTRNLSRLFIAKSLLSYYDGNTDYALTLADNSCKLGNGNGCLLEIIDLTKKMKDSDGMRIYNTSLLARIMELEVKSCNLGQPYSCYAFIHEVKDLEKDGDLDVALKFRDPQYQYLFREGVMQDCMKSYNNYNYCRLKANIITNNLITMSKVITDNFYKLDYYKNRECSLAKTFKIHQLYDATPIEIKVYDVFAKKVYNNIQTKVYKDCGIRW